MDGAGCVFFQTELFDGERAVNDTHFLVKKDFINDTVTVHKNGALL